MVFYPSQHVNLWSETLNPTSTFVCLFRMESILDRYEQYAEAEYECETYEDDNELVKDHDQYSHANTNNDQVSWFVYNN